MKDNSNIVTINNEHTVAVGKNADASFTPLSLLSILAVIKAFFSSKAVKAALITVCFFIFLFIIAAFEAGTLTFTSAFLITLIMGSVEFVLLK